MQEVQGNCYELLHGCECDASAMTGSGASC